MALTLLTANNAQTVLAAGISASATTLTVNTGTGALFPSPVSGTSYFKLTLIDATTGQLTEIVHVTSRTGDTMTISRAQEGTTARAWSANDIAANMLTAGTIALLAPLDSPAFTGTPTAPTATAGTSTTQIASTAFVGAAIVAATGRLAAIQKFTSSGTYTPTPGVTKIIVEMVGGGGGGGGAPAGSSTSNSVGGGGGSGAYARASIASPAASYAITIGNGGAAGGSGSGGGGGSSTFGTLITCVGGSGGNTGTANGAPNAAGGGFGGSATVTSPAVAIFSATGGFGSPGYMITGGSGNGGNGASVQLGNGGFGSANGAGSPGGGYGSGGGGALTTTTNTSQQNGGIGAAGIVIIYEYY